MSARTVKKQLSQLVNPPAPASKEALQQTARKDKLKKKKQAEKAVRDFLDT